jgi:ketosteroid isomerase-like protein
MWRKETSRLYGAALVALGLANAAGAQSTCSESDSAAAVAIRQRLMQWVDASNRADVAAAREIWAPDRLSDFIGWYPRGAVLVDSAAYAAAGLPYRPDAAAGEVTFELRVEDVAATGGIARARDEWVETRRLPGARGVVRRTTRGAALWRCQPDGWWRIARRENDAAAPWEYVAPASDSLSQRGPRS